jgi:hypothetical protein
VFLIVALVGLVTIFGTNEQPIKTKSFGNNVIFHSNLLKNYLNPPEIDPEITTQIMGGRPLLDIPETNLPDDFVFVSPCLEDAGRCTPDGSYCANYPQGYKRL